MSYPLTIYTVRTSPFRTQSSECRQVLFVSHKARTKLQLQSSHRSTSGSLSLALQSDRLLFPDGTTKEVSDVYSSVDALFAARSTHRSNKYPSNSILISLLRSSCYDLRGCLYGSSLMKRDLPFGSASSNVY